MWLQGYERGGMMPEERQPAEASFAERYAALSKAVFTDLIRDAIASGHDPDDAAREYAARGKPDFALAYLLAGTLSDAERQETLAQAFERRAEVTEARAREFDGKFHRPFPLLISEAANDRATARTIRAGKPVRPGAGRQLPMI